MSQTRRNKGFGGRKFLMKPNGSLTVGENRYATLGQRKLPSARCAAGRGHLRTRFKTPTASVSTSA